MHSAIDALHSRLSRLELAVFLNDETSLKKKEETGVLARSPHSRRETSQLTTPGPAVSELPPCRNAADRVKAIMANIAGAEQSTFIRDLNPKLQRVWGLIDAMGIDDPPSEEQWTGSLAPLMVAGIEETLAVGAEALRKVTTAVNRAQAIDRELVNTHVEAWATRIGTATSQNPAVSLYELSRAPQLPAVLYLDPAELDETLVNAERSLRCLERLRDLQARQIRFSAYVSDRLHAIEREVAAREARCAHVRKADL